jgi:hypothetical protein
MIRPMYGHAFRTSVFLAGLSQKRSDIEAAGLDIFVASTGISRYKLEGHKVECAFLLRLATVLQVPVFI